MLVETATSLLWDKNVVSIITLILNDSNFGTQMFVTCDMY
jgi:hypothetical protein